MKKQGSRVVVIGGCGTVGSLMARVLKDSGADVTVSDLSTDSPQVEILKKEGINLNLGEHDETILKDADTIVVAPSLLKNQRVIQKIKKVTDVDKVMSTIHSAKPGNEFKIKVLRNKKEMTFDVKIPRQLKTTNI